MLSFALSHQIMMILLHLILVLIGTFSVVQCRSSYVVTCSDRIIPGIPLDVRASILTSQGDVTVATSLEDSAGNKIFSKESKTIAKGATDYIQLQVPDDLPYASYKLVVHGSGGLSFQNESRLLYEDKWPLIYIQTDKTRYSAGQEVKYRVIFLLPNLLGYKGDAYITIYDGNRNKVDVLGPLKPTEGIINGTLQLSSEPVFGDWEIEASALTQSSSKGLTVNDYVLPKFSVNINLPAKVRKTDSVLHVNVSARFTFNTDVFGNCTLQLYNPSNTYKYLVFSKEIKGRVEFDIPMSDISTKFGSSLVTIRALVTDNATALTIANEKDLEYYQDTYSTQKPITVQVVDEKRDAFVPGLTYYSTLFVGRDKEPLGTKGTITVTPTITAAQLLPCYLNSPLTQWLQVETLTLQTFSTDFDESGYAPLKFHVPLHTEIVTLEIKYGSLTETISISSVPRNSPTLLRMYPNLPNAKVGDWLSFTTEATAPLTGSLLVEVYAGGFITATKVIMVQSKNKTTFSLPITHDMVPEAIVLLTHITLQGNLINDYNVIHVDDTPFKNNVSITFNKSVFQPGESISIHISADPNSTVYVLSEDKKNRLLGEENDVYRSEVLADVLKRTIDIEDNINSYSSLSSSVGKRGLRLRRDRGVYGDTDDTFIETGALFLSDVPVFDITTVGTDFLSNDYSIPRKCFHITTTAPGLFPLPAPGMTYAPGMFPTWVPGMVPTPAPGFTYAPYTIPVPVGQQLALGTLVRSKFPETWIWDEYKIGQSGTLDITMKVPDAITSWITSVFATNEFTGFGIQDLKSSITVKKNFFVTMDVPPSIIHGEEFLLQLTVFNYMTTVQQVFLQVTTTDDQSNPLPAATVVKPGSGHSTFLHITPKNIGTMKINVVARAGFFTSTSMDTLEREIVVKPHGVHRKDNEQHMIDVSALGGPFVKAIAFKTPVNYVNGTKSAKLRITGNFMVPSIDGLQNLLGMPHGCGEQVMVDFAPDIYILKYLKAAGKLKPNVDARSLAYLKSGFQQELNYQQHDGSFSAFTFDRPGSSWLTAFVLKCFRQARGLINIDNTIMEKAMTWLLQYQHQDGSFYETGRVIDTHMQAGTSSGLKLTAFIFNAVLENRDLPGVNNAILTRAIQRSQGYLESEMNNIRDMYTLAIVCYSLSKAGSSHATTCFTKLKSHAIIDGETAHWEANDYVHKRRSIGPRAANRRIQSIDIETTAYCLLTYMELGQTGDALAIVKWLVSQRNPNGGFQSTQDTVITLQALAEYASRHNKSDPHHNVILQVYSGNYHHSYVVTPSNSDIVHHAQVPDDLSDLVVYASGQGVAVVDVTMSYYISGVSGSTLSVTATLPKETINSVTVRPCMRWHGTSTSGMILMEVEMPTGFIPDVDTLKSQTVIKRQETNGRNVALYFHGIVASGEVCVDVKMDRSDPVVRSQACHITVYDYYEPTNQVMIRYESGILKSSNICDVCPLCNFCTGSTGVGLIGVGK